jgi:hypothetical protein
MNRFPGHPLRQSTKRDKIRDELSTKLAGLDEPQLELLLEFIEQVIDCHDPEAVGTFLDWRKDPLIGSILQLASALSGDQREQLLYAAETLYSTKTRRH